LNDLKKAYTEQEANTIFVLACINLIKGYTHLKNFKKIYDNSYFSVCYKKVCNLSKNAVADFLLKLGA
jgi:hypothetical protein